jgi:hypothetical protein
MDGGLRSIAPVDRDAVFLARQSITGARFESIFFFWMNACTGVSHAGRSGIAACRIVPSGQTPVMLNIGEPIDFC